MCLVTDGGGHTSWRKHRTFENQRESLNIEQVDFKEYTWQMFLIHKQELGEHCETSKM